VAAALVLWSRCSLPKTPPRGRRSGITAVGLVARTIGGHMSASSVGGIAIALHVLAAGDVVRDAGRAGVDGRPSRQWARVLPRFSELSLLCVIALLTGGVDRVLSLRWIRRRSCSHRIRPCVADQDRADCCVDGAGLAQPRPLVACGKVTSRHRLRSRARSLTELAIMAVALAMAAALSVTG
jgi:putative copper resistance protein D